MDPLFDPHHGFEHDPVSDRHHRFDDARREAIIHRLLRMLTHQSTTLVPFDEVRSRLRHAPTIARGGQIIPVDAIVGSVERYRDFTNEFLPLNEELEARWERLNEATMRLVNIPPIDVYKLGEIYFVRDGNHRVSVARFNHAAVIEANVTEIPLKVPLTADMDVNHLILAAERSEFLIRTGLDDLRPAADITFTAPGRYQEVLEQIDVHRWHLGVERGAEVPYSEAVVSWYDNVYEPACEAISQSGLLRSFPDRTPADLYLWTMRHLTQLRETYSKAVDTRMAANDLAREHPAQPLGRVARAVKKAQAALSGDDVPPIIDDLLDKLEEQERLAEQQGRDTPPDPTPEST
ncbi:MAG TPA: hypothetical protein VEZ12_23880 [Herpetosiphonaceae bacterium]|nr:hypothetical protein [Herpetosiphonaceae bacterium]